MLLPTRVMHSFLFSNAFTLLITPSSTEKNVQVGILLWQLFGTSVGVYVGVSDRTLSIFWFS